MKIYTKIFIVLFILIFITIPKLYPITFFSNDFEFGNGDMDLTGSWFGNWQCGMPTSGPMSANSGNNCWGVNLAANYFNDSWEVLTITNLNLSGSSLVLLKFFHYMNSQVSQDGGNIRISTNNGLSYFVLPTANYDSPNVTGLSNEPGWSESFWWKEEIVDLSVFTNRTIDVQFLFGSDSSINFPGWYIDDVFITDSIAGLGIMTTDKRAALSGSTNTFSFTYIASFNMSGGQVMLDIPADWTTPVTTGSNNLGHVKVVPGTGTPILGAINTPTNRIEVNITTMLPGDSFTIIYGNGLGAKVQNTQTNVVFNAFSKGPIGPEKPLFKSPMISVHNMITIPYFNGFESDNGYFFQEDSTHYFWEHGMPFSGPWSGYVSANCWSLLKDSSYSNLYNARCRLEIPAVDLTAEEFASLEFYHYLDVDAWKDGGNVSISTNNGSTYEVIDPYIGHYNEGSLPGLDWEQAWSTNTAGWKLIKLDLTPYVGNVVNIRFNFGTDNASGGGAGWYIDNVKITNSHIPLSGTGILTVDPGGVIGGKTNTFVFTFTATNDYVKGSRLKINVPFAAGWSTPQVTNSNVIGYVKAIPTVNSPVITTAPEITNNSIIVIMTNVKIGDEFEIHYGYRSGAQASMMLGNHIFNASSKGFQDTYMMLDQSPIITIQPLISIPYFNDFEGNDGYFSETTDSGHLLWEHGNPFSGPWGGYLSINCWGTALFGNYTNNQKDYITTPYIDLTSTAYAYLEIMHWFKTRYNKDGGNIAISIDDGNSWEIVGDSSAYNSPSIDGLYNTKGWSGTNAVWIKSIIDLTPYTGNMALIRFNFGSDGNDTMAGWYIDNLKITNSVPPAAGTGKASISPEIVKTNEYNEFKIGYKFESVIYSGKVSVDIPQGFTKPQITDSDEEGYIEIETVNGSPLIDTIPTITGSGPGPWTIAVTIAQANPNDRIRIIYGSQQSGGPGSKISTSSEKGYTFTVKSATISEPVTQISNSPTVYSMKLESIPFIAPFDMPAEVKFVYGYGSSTTNASGWRENTCANIPPDPCASVAGTDVDISSYPSGAKLNYTSYFIDLKNEEYARLTLSHFYRTEPGDDGGNIRISTNKGQSFFLIGSTNDNFYNTNYISALGEPGWSGDSINYVTNVLDLSDYVGKEIIIQFHFKSDNDAMNNYGWYLENVRIDDSPPPAAGSGTATIDNELVTTGSTNEFNIVFTSDRVLDGGRVEFMIPAGFSTPQNSFPNNFGYVTVTPGAGSPTISSIPSISGNGPWTNTISVVDMQPNDTFTFTYGDMSSGGKGAVACTNYTNVAFYVRTAAQSEETKEIKDSPETFVIDSVTPPRYWSFFMDAESWLEKDSSEPVWEFGMPMSGPNNALPPGNNAWGTKLNGFYDVNDADAYLHSPQVDLTGLSEAYIKFWHWYDFEEGVDGGNIEISIDDGENYEILGSYEDENYPYQAVSGLSNQDGFSGTTKGNWKSALFDLSSYAGNKILLRFHFGTDDTNNYYPGWYIDEIEVNPGPPPIAGKGEASISPLYSEPSKTNNFYITFVSKAEMDGGVVQVSVPSNWSKPTNSSAENGYISVSPGIGSPTLGAVQISNYIIIIPTIAMSNDETLIITYSNAVVTASNGMSVFFTKTAGTNELPSDIFKNPKVNVQPIIRPPYTNDFEFNDGYFIREGNYIDDWQRGWPTMGPGNAHSGSYCWGTRLWDYYQNDSDIHLITPMIDLTSVPAATFSFYHYFEIDAGYDGANVSISTDGINFKVLGSYGNPYNYSTSDVIDEPVFSGWHMWWEDVYFDLSAYIGKNVWISFNFYSGEIDNFSGYYFDYISITTNLPPVAGTGTVDVSPSGVNMGSTNNYQFTFTAERQMNNGEVRLEFPFDWTVPQTNNSSAPGFIKVTPGTGSPTISIDSISNLGWETAIIKVTTMNADDTFILTYSNAVAPTNAGDYFFGASTRGETEFPMPIDFTKIIVQDILVPPFTLSFTNEEGFIVDPFGFSMQWQQGPPTVGPMGGYGTNDNECWGININSAFYMDNSRDILKSPIIDLTSVLRANLSFYQWYSMPWGDGGNITVSTDMGMTWEIIGTNNNFIYDSDEIEGLMYQPGFSGWREEWHKITVSLNKYLGKLIVISFNFGSDWNGWSQDGWFIDELSVSTNYPPIAGTGIGTLTPTSVIAESTNTFIFTYTATEELRDGSLLAFGYPHGWTVPQINSPSSNGYFKLTQLNGTSTFGEIFFTNVTGNSNIGDFYVIGIPVTNMAVSNKIQCVFSNISTISNHGGNEFIIVSGGPGEMLEPIGDKPLTVNVLKILSVPFLHNFETNNNGWIPSDPWGDGWNWGEIETWMWGSPGFAYSGTNVWGFHLNREYFDNEYSYLLSPLIDLTTASFASLEFWHFYNTDPIGDGGNILISTNNGNTFNLLGNYPEHYNKDKIYPLNRKPGWSGWSAGWRKKIIDLTSYVNHKIQLKFQFASDNYSSFMEPNYGWLIDDVAVKAALPPVAGTGTAVITPTVLEMGSTNIFRVTYTASRTIKNGKILVKIPNTWPNPHGNVSITNTAGSPDCGKPITSSILWSVIIPVTNMAKDESITLIYGSKNDIVVPSNSQVYKFNVSVKGPDENYGNINSSPTVQLISLLNVPFTTDFESDDSDFTIENSLYDMWDWGSPTHGPSKANSDVRCWGVDLDGDYSIDNTREYLTTPFIDLEWTTNNSGITIRVTNAHMTFYQYYEFENNKDGDGGNVSISTDGVNYKVLTPYRENYNATMIDGLDNEQGWAGTGTNWKKQTFILDNYIGKKVRIRFKFGSDSFDSDYAGWYIDDLGIYTTPPSRLTVEFAESTVKLGIANSGRKTYGVAAGDLDGDNDIDIITYNYGFNSDEIWINDGTGIFTTANSVPESTTYFMELSDINNDGYLDAISGNNEKENTSSENKIFVNDGNESFTYNSGGMPGNGATTYGLAAGDIDNDGDYDIVVANEGDDIIWINNGDGTYISSGYLTEGKSRCLIIRDLNNDNYLDIVVGHYGFEKPNRVWINNGDGTFQKITESLGHYNVNSIDAGDINDDGDQDIIFGCDGKNQIWTNDGNGNFKYFSAISTNSKYNTIGIKLCDVDCDNDLDILCANYLGPDKIWLNEIETRGKFEDSGNNLGMYESTHCSVADVDSDGDIDFIVGVNGRESVIWLNKTADYGTTNRAPSPPSTMNASISEGAATISWSKGSDLETTSSNLLTYNIRIGYKPGGNDVMSIGGSVNNSFAVKPGNVGNSRNWTINNVKKISYYYISIQTVDAGFRCSPWVTKKIYFDPLAPKENELKISDNFMNLNNGDCTIITYNVNTESALSIKIYTLDGTVVGTLVDEGSKISGYDSESGTITWCGRNINGSYIGPGLYWVIMRYDNIVRRKRILIVR